MAPHEVRDPLPGDVLRRDHDPWYFSYAVSRTMSTWVVPNVALIIALGEVTDRYGVREIRAWALVEGALVLGEVSTARV